MKQHIVGIYNKYAYFIGGATIVPSIYLATGRLVLAITGYSLGYASMLIIEKVLKS